MRYRVHALSAACGLVLAAGCINPIEDLDPMTRSLLHESGGDQEAPGGRLYSKSNIIVGLAPLQYDLDYDSGPGSFRMALMVVARDGTKIHDFFKGLPDLATRPEHIAVVGRGNARHAVPRILPDHLKSNADAKAFADQFPEYIDKEFELTFKEFSGRAYYLKDAPSGTAFVWIQTSFDGNRVIQYPIAVELSPKKGAINRLDIDSGGVMRRFHEL